MPQDLGCAVFVTDTPALRLQYPAEMFDINLLELAQSTIILSRPIE
jgi:hypothetical protein